MQVIRSFQDTDATFVGYGVRVLLVTHEGESSVLARRLSSLGGRVEVIDEFFTGLSDVLDDPVGFGLFVIDCDSANVGGLEGGRRAVQIMGEMVSRIPVILISKECGEQSFPDDRLAPTLLRAPLSSVSLRVGFEHALRERLAYRAH